MTNEEMVQKILDDIHELTVIVTDLRILVGQLQVKSGIWGAIAGMIPVSVGIIIYYILK